MRLGSWDAKIYKNTLTYTIYKKHKAFKDEVSGIASERHRHRYEFNNKYLNMFKKTGMIISATSVSEGLVEIIELPKNKHPFYVGTQGHPEYKSKPNHPHPIFIEFVKSCLKSNS